MRIVFAGTPAVAVPTLRALTASSHEVAAVITRTDAPQGRRRVLTPSAVAAEAGTLGLPVIKTDTLDAATTADVAALAPDLGVIVAYGGLVREPLLSTPRHGWINLHFSRLPRWRGAAPVQRALIAGDREIGAAVFQLVAALDAGDVFDEIVYTPGPLDTAGEVLAHLAEIGAPLVTGVIDALADGTARAHPQAGEPTLAPKLSIADGALDFTESATRVLDRVRGTTPEPGAYTSLGGARLKILRASLGDPLPLEPGEVAYIDKSVLVGTGAGTLELHQVQPAGKGAMAASDWWRGLRDEHPRLGS